MSRRFAARCGFGAEQTLGGESTCIICFTQPKSHAAVPCGHRCACADCSAKIMERDRRCPYCREEVMMWMIPRETGDGTTAECSPSCQSRSRRVVLQICGTLSLTVRKQVHYFTRASVTVTLE
ncbi:hypothetical protein EMIHUDRAFT_233779 [Emiliania huxleyi CCMP1516]|uniref:RING-type domain-containing protein n=2 Tax=Emiliania huxleyi TaxID=2903 RepID=A0A0D3K1C9_EMIH1|nr:hypothetical protein EMIHUDRAFT_233779 [Emiliania huxleyi CCMP1516]EOD29564.1 hypothetical protein EMIHUDRAFT_233779 [Emiliania huxleyi CCMP1516]|eukprot:XP_005781993.1 hypothetical protein EMIHUDRAFT_233779 [Emiliania huxleyi CCMP1516]